MSKQFNSPGFQKNSKSEHGPFSTEGLLGNLKDKELNETLGKVKLQVRNLVEQTQSNAKKQNGNVSEEALKRAKALEQLVAGVDQIINSLYQLRK